MTKTIVSEPKSMEERATRLRTELLPTTRGQSIMKELFPAKMLQAAQNVVDFSDWGQKTSNWSEED